MEEFTDTFPDPTTLACPWPTPVALVTAPLKVTKPSDYDSSHDKYEMFTRELAIYLATTPLATECQKIMVTLSFMKMGSATLSGYVLRVTGFLGPGLHSNKHVDTC
jgi:hypothetical protein